MESEDEGRQPIEFIEVPEAAFCQVLGASMKLSVVADGKTHVFRLSRMRLLSLMESGFEALKELEPGWRDL